MANMQKKVLNIAIKKGVNNRFIDCNKQGVEVTRAKLQYLYFVSRGRKVQFITP